MKHDQLMGVMWCMGILQREKVEVNDTLESWGKWAVVAPAPNGTEE
jgi:hypothetical protein